MVWKACIGYLHGAGISSGCHSENGMNPSWRDEVKPELLGSVPELRKPQSKSR